LKKDIEKCAAVVLFNEQEEVLILFRNPHISQWMPGKWSVPGGHLLEGEGEREGVSRELFEETNLFVPLEALSLIERRGRMSFYTANEFYGKIMLDEYENTGYVWASEKTLNLLDGVPQLKHTVGVAKQRRKEDG
jgi:8-oxo-dGTP pyrophosphatase MutT (NUDIX family)